MDNGMKYSIEATRNKLSDWRFWDIRVILVVHKWSWGSWIGFTPSGKKNPLNLPEIPSSALMSPYKIDISQLDWVKGQSFSSARESLQDDSLLKLPRKATPSESWLLDLACAPTTPQPRPSNTMPSPPIRKLEVCRARERQSWKVAAAQNGNAVVREASLVSDVIKFPIGHVMRLDASHNSNPLVHVGAGLGVRVVDDHSPDFVFLKFLTSRKIGLPIVSRDHGHWKSLRGKKTLNVKWMKVECIAKDTGTVGWW